MDYCKHGLLPETCGYCTGLIKPKQQEDDEDEHMTYISRWERETDNNTEYNRLCHDMRLKYSRKERIYYRDPIAHLGICCFYCETWFKQPEEQEVYTCPCCHKSFSHGVAEIYEYHEGDSECEPVTNAGKDSNRKKKGKKSARKRV